MGISPAIDPNAFPVRWYNLELVPIPPVIIDYHNMLRSIIDSCFLHGLMWSIYNSTIDKMIILDGIILVSPSISYKNLMISLTISRSIGGRSPPQSQPIQSPLRPSVELRSLANAGLAPSVQVASEKLQGPLKNRGKSTVVLSVWFFVGDTILLNEMIWNETRQESCGMLWVKQIEQGRKQIISNLDLIDGLVFKNKCLNVLGFQSAPC